MQHVKNALLAGRQALNETLGNKETLIQIQSAGDRLVEAFRASAKVYSCGNGGSLCDAMHFAEELSGRFRENRVALPALAIADPAHLSCVANDFGYQDVFSRFMEAHGRKGDVLLAISTSGSSENVLRAARVAYDRGLDVIGLTGCLESKLRELSTFYICTPGGSRFSDRIQEMHIKVIHILIELVERQLFPHLYA